MYIKYKTHMRLYNRGKDNHGNCCTRITYYIYLLPVWTKSQIIEQKESVRATFCRCLVPTGNFRYIFHL